jgi:4'-phosphopantetheinyl transferase
MPKRRTDWRLGRWCAKAGLRAFARLSAPLADLEVLADPDGGPRAWLGDRPLPVALSLSHRDGRAAGAVSDGNLRLGCDLETVEPRSDGFLRDYLTAREADRAFGLPPDRRALHAALVWSAKESALKALRTGLRRDTRSVEVTHLDEDDAGVPGWHPLAVRDAETGALLPGWWRALDGQVLTVVADRDDAAPPSERPRAVSAPRPAVRPAPARRARQPRPAAAAT